MRTKGLPIERAIGGSVYRNSHSDYLLQIANLIAHALLKQEEEPSPRVEHLGIRRAVGILDRALNRMASSDGETTGRLARLTDVGNSCGSCVPHITMGMCQAGGPPRFKVVTVSQ